MFIENRVRILILSLTLVLLPIITNAQSNETPIGKPLPWNDSIMFYRFINLHKSIFCVGGKLITRREPVGPADVSFYECIGGYLISNDGRYSVVCTDKIYLFYDFLYTPSGIDRKLLDIRCGSSAVQTGNKYIVNYAQSLNLEALHQMEALITRKSLGDLSSSIREAHDVFVRDSLDLISKELKLIPNYVLNDPAIKSKFDEIDKKLNELIKRIDTLENTSKKR